MPFMQVLKPMQGKGHALAEDRIAVAETLRTGLDAPDDFLRELVRTTLQTLMEAAVASQIGAERYEHSSERITQRHGYRSRPFDTRVGTIELAIPKLRQGSYFPSWLEARRRGEQALSAWWRKPMCRASRRARSKRWCSNWGSVESAKVT